MARKSRNPKPKTSKSKKSAALEKKLGYTFRNREFLELALTHSSFTVEEFTDNERLEFLGDSVLGLAVSEHLYRELPRAPEGELTRIKSVAVSTAALARVSRSIGLAEFMHIGKGLGDRGKLPDSVHANVTEAVFAAVYLDGGYPAARKLIVKLLDAEIKGVTAAAGSENAKSQLQELAQREMGSSPRYRLVTESGPQHGKTFTVAVELGRRTFPGFSGNTKKEAEQGAARLALEELQGKKEKAAEKPKAARPAARKATRRAGRRKRARKQTAAKKKASGKTAKKKPARRRKAARNPYDALAE